MELSSQQVYTTTTSSDFGKGFAFPAIDIDLTPTTEAKAEAKANEAKANAAVDPRYAQVALSTEEMALAASATPEGVDFAYTSGEFSGTSDLEAEGLENPAGITYLGSGTIEIADDEMIGTVAQASAQASDEASASEVGESCPVLYPCDLDLIEEIKAKGCAISIESALSIHDPESLVRIVAAGRAVGEVVDGERIFSLTDATRREVARAATATALARVEQQQDDIERQSARMRNLVLGNLYSRGANAAFGEPVGGAASLDSILGRIVALMRSSATVNRASARTALRGFVSEGSLSCKQARDTVYVGLPGAGREEYVRAARLVQAATVQTKHNLKVRGKVFADGAWYPPETESGPDPRGASAPRDYADATRLDAVIPTASGRPLAPSRNARQKAAAGWRVGKALARAAKSGLTPEDVAWRTAVSLHLSGVEDPAERLLLLLQAKGRKSWTKLEAGSADPAELKKAARALADSGSLKAQKGKTSGNLYVSAASELASHEREELERTLLRLMVTGRVTVPTGTALARRVAAHKGVIRREATAQANAQANAQATAQATTVAAA